MDFASFCIALFLFVFGASIGSFLNVIIYRLPRGESITGVASGSHCPRCGRALRAGDLIPLISWVSLKGRCRSCGTRISARYFGVELATGILFVIAGATEQGPFDPGVGMLHKILLISLFVPIFFIDVDHKIVPDSLSVPLILIGFIWNIIDGTHGRAGLTTLQPNVIDFAPTSFAITLPNSLVNACICAGIFWLIQWFGEVVFKKEAMGLGDVNIAAGIGANFPLLLSLCSFGIAIGVGALFGILLMLLRPGGRAAEIIAFGPMLVTGGLLILYFPDPILHLVQMYRLSMGVHP